MRFVLALLTRLASERGQTASEYALLIVWVALIIMVGATTLGTHISHAISSTAGHV